MSDKSFEQQVREELSDLRMKPDAAVWESVAASLQKERKRRWVLWMVILLTVLSGATFWWHTGEQTSNHEISKNIQPQHNAENVPAQKGSTVEEPVEASATEQQNHNDLLLPAQKREKEKQEPDAIALNRPAVKPLSDRPSLYQKSVLQRENTNTTEQVTEGAEQQSKDKLIAADIIVKKNADEKADPSVQASVQGSKQIVADTLSSIPTHSVKTDSLTIAVQTAMVPSSFSDTMPSADKKIKTNKWQWRIAFNAGTSGLRNSLRSLLEPTNSRAYENAFLGTASAGPGGGSGSGAMSTKPVVRDAFAFATSFEAYKKMGKKEQHALGITAGYQMYSIRTGVGSINTGTVRFSNVNADNDANRYFSVKDSASYQSYYHFLQFGMLYYRSLKWWKKTDLQLYGGMGINALVASNGLHLGSTSTGTYLFENRSLLRTIQVDLSGGFDVSIGKTKQLFLGPQIQYMLSNLSRQSGVNQHLFRPSLRVSFRLDKRK